MSYTFDEICESQEFNHDQEFIEIERFNHLEQKLAKQNEIIEIIKLKKDSGWLFTYDDMVELNKKLKELGE